MTTKVDPDRRNILLAGTTLAIASVLAGGSTSVVAAETSSLNAQPLPPSPEWARALPPGPDARESSAGLRVEERLICSHRW